MINDIFLRRYPAKLIFSDRVPPDFSKFFVQVAHIVFQDVTPHLLLDQKFFRTIHDALARELGVGLLFDGDRFDEVCGKFLTERFDLWIDRHGDPDKFVKMRLSLIELMFRGFEERTREKPPKEKIRAQGFIAGLMRLHTNAVEKNLSNHDIVRRAVAELNERFRLSNMNLHYHNGLIQFATDKLTEQHIAEPFWSLLQDSQWRNVDREMKEALDRADGRHADAAFHAAKALESTIKVISDRRNWTSGRETGAASYIDNLVSQKNGRFIEPWEAELLKAFFKHVRNPYGHGSGSQASPSLTDSQVRWVIEHCMSWTKALILRL